jgi:hypothetical protein
LHATESTSDIGDHHVADHELRSGVRWIEFVSRFMEFLFSLFRRIR